MRKRYADEQRNADPRRVLGLVVLTVVGIGTLFQWMLHTIPPSTEFAIAAVIAPAIPTSVSALAPKFSVPLVSR